MQTTRKLGMGEAKATYSRSFLLRVITAALIAVSLMMVTGTAYAEDLSDMPEGTIVFAATAEETPAPQADAVDAIATDAAPEKMNLEAVDPETTMTEAEPTETMSKDTAIETDAAGGGVSSDSNTTTLNECYVDSTVQDSASSPDAVDNTTNDSNVASENKKDSTTSSQMIANSNDAEQSIVQSVNQPQADDSTIKQSEPIESSDNVAKAGIAKVNSIKPLSNNITTLGDNTATATINLTLSSGLSFESAYLSSDNFSADTFTSNLLDINGDEVEKSMLPNRLRAKGLQPGSPLKRFLDAFYSGKYSYSADKKTLTLTITYMVDDEENEIYASDLCGTTGDLGSLFLPTLAVMTCQTGSMWNIGDVEYNLAMKEYGATWTDFMQDNSVPDSTTNCVFKADLDPGREVRIHVPATGTSGDITNTGDSNKGRYYKGQDKMFP